MILEEQMRSRYMEYALKNEIKYDINDEESLFLECNKHHHMMNCLGEHHINDTNCSDYYIDCDERIGILSNDYDYHVSGECSCGRYIWSSENPPTNLFDFNLDSTEVYGTIYKRD